MKKPHSPLLGASTTRPSISGGLYPLHLGTRKDPVSLQLLLMIVLITKTRKTNDLETGDGLHFSPQDLNFDDLCLCFLVLSTLDSSFSTMFFNIDPKLPAED